MQRRDFTLDAYGQLLDALQEGGYACITYLEYSSGKAMPERFVILRHDVDRHPWRSVAAARLEADRQMLGTYYFRIVPESLDADALRAIRDLGHEIGYHYEDLALAAGDMSVAIRMFDANLAVLRSLAPIRTICMHGSPTSRWDNRALWQKHSYRDRGILGEPYLDTDFEQVFYISDTGRRWNNTAASVRDKVRTTLRFEVESTFSLQADIRAGRAPSRMMITLHPQRWTEGTMPWLWEYVAQQFKNVIKRFITRRRAT